MADPADSDRSFPPAVTDHYRVLSRLGAGGMGVVYKATDTHLNRAVAIKAIHDPRARDGQRTARLRAEALAAASLDHPYICKIYELIEADDETFIVMEFVEGETLAAILHRGMPPLAETLRLACEIAEGLANAHEKGLVHRDVKPSNVLVTANGHVKLLDFGLARPDATGLPGDLTATSPAHTDDRGGTVQYMAPEQATGGAVTARADLFSLGVMIFECLTGRLPFEGSTGYDYVRHLITDNARPIHRLAPHAPSDLVNLVEECLEKTPARRPESAAALVTRLRRIADALTTPGVVLGTVRAERRKRRWRALAGVGLLAVGAIVAWQWRAQLAPVAVERQSRPFVTSPNEESESRISPDSRWVAFLSTRGGITRVFVQPIDGADAQAVALPAGKVQSFVWSPDGRELASVIVQDDRAVLQIVAAFFGGIPRHTIALGPAASSLRLLRWIDQAVYLQINGSPGRTLERVDLGTGTMTNLSAGWHVDGTLRSFDVRPDGRRAAFTLTANGAEDLWIAELDGSAATRLTDDAFFDRSPLWVGDGATIIYQSNRGGQVDLWEIDPASRQTWQVTSSQTYEQPESTSPDGSIVSFQQASDEARLWSWPDADRPGRQLTAEALSDLSPAASRDGRVLVFQRSQARPAEGFQILDSKLLVASMTSGGFASEPRPVADGFAARPSPDGARVAYLQRTANPARMQLRVTHLGTNDTVTVSTTCPPPAYSQFPVDWVEELMAWNTAGTELYYVEQPDGFVLRRYRVGEPAPGAALFTAGPTERMRDPRVSVDGRRLAFLTYLNRTFSVHVLDVSTGQDRVVGSLPGSMNGLFLRGWMPDHSTLVLAQSTAAHDDFTADVDVLLVSLAGTVRRVGTIERSYFASTRLVPSQSAIFATRSDQGIHNLVAVDLSSGRIRVITDNMLPGVTFSGVEPLGGSGFVGVRSERKRDVWLLEAAPARPGAAPGRIARRP